ncbi:MAG: aldehyde ferredoxin oxidoreductase family protein [Anaerolineales bacterium]|nr:aldehyde ferredoxin oxidoreductase family protein [Anaerolineales bacterium]
MQPILKIDLTLGEVSRIQVPADWEQAYLGGASLAARLLYDRLTPDLDPLSPQAPLLFLNGPLSGTSGPAVGRFVVCGRSPATYLWAESNCGGFWGAELRMAGYDGLWIEGHAARPVYLWIQDRRVEIRSAEHLWGSDTYQTQTAIEQELGVGKVRVASIGMAGENRIPFALILCDHGRVAGRTGMGAVMGAKNLKAIAIQGHGEIPVFDPERYHSLRSSSNKTLRSDAMTLVLRELGTSSVAEYMDYLAEMPKRYFSRGKSNEEILTTGANMKDTILAGVSACHACVIACGRVARLEDGAKRKGPEYETIVGFGPNLMLNDLKLITRLGELCDRYGMDSISTSNIIGLAFRLYEMGKITLQDTQGIELTWGNAAAVERLVHLIARRQDFGACLAEGARALGRRYHAEKEAVQVNGLEAPYHDPRGASGMALVYATSPRGACHNQSDYFLVDIGQVESSLGLEYFDRLGGAEKACNVAIHQNWRTLQNSLVMCLFANLEPAMVLDLINAACGLGWDIADMLRCGERGWNLKRVINNRLGLTRTNDRLPKAFLQSYQDSASGERDFIPDFEAMLPAYYQARGWNWDTGRPNPEKLTELGLDFVIPDLFPEGAKVG